MKNILINSVAAIAAVMVLLLAFYHGIGRELCAKGDLSQAEQAEMRLNCN